MSPPRESLETPVSNATECMGQQHKAQESLHVYQLLPLQNLSNSITTLDPRADMASRTAAVTQDVVNACILLAFYVSQHMTTDVVCLYDHTLILGFIYKDPSFLAPELHLLSHSLSQSPSPKGELAAVGIQQDVVEPTAAWVVINSGYLMGVLISGQ